MPKPSEDFLLWNDFRNGEEYALAEIYSRYADSLYSYGKKFTSNSEIVKDTIQDLFFNLIRTRSKLGTTDNVYFYLLRSYRRALSRNLKKTENTKVFQLNTDLPAMQLRYHLEEELLQKESLDNRERIILRSLQQLSPKQREIIYYRFTCDFDYEQICELMKLKYDSARKMVFRAIKILREHLENDKQLILLVLNFQ
ncbi:RNA polymerase sigma factor [Mangrovibacterium diazotrophicum]|uniref:RNA polymerase sigma factor (Sigma-70 family) n=1 Tax=Mangrovibacterium diazotrophicum TaxID=1261403 RepID=A0A419W5A3_9BACT|nr:sigma-70 family RNA polymerase sigma factor [Mangrovibacterium diazotrophicum]RKD90627.1 RNA polymerase sigma factor (sigma-70 family) [Mangrovibacterium diazotrophicum]